MRRPAPLLLLLLAPVLFGAAFVIARWRAAPPRLGPPGWDRPASLEQAWRAHLAGRAAEVHEQLALLGPEGGAPRVREEAELLRALADGDVAALERLAEGTGGVPRPVIAAAQRALARGLAPEASRAGWAARFVREFPRSWAAVEVAASGRR